MTPEQRRRRAQARVRAELLAEGLSEAELEELPEGVYPLGQVLDELVVGIVDLATHPR